jgi:hypothetical protein
MRGTTLAVFVLVLICGCAVTAHQGDEAARDLEPVPFQDDAVVSPGQITDAEMDAALSTWRRYEMPEPPEDAPLVEVVWRSVQVFVGPQPRALAFLIEPGEPPGSAVVFDGAAPLVIDLSWVSEGKRDEVRWIDPSVAAVSGDLSWLWSYGGDLFRYSRHFAIGLHCWARGHRELGRYLVAKYVGEALMSPRDFVLSPRGDTVQESVGAVIWSHWFNEIFRPGTDRRAIHGILTRAIGEFKCITPEWRPHANTELLAQLGESLEPSTAEPGSARHLIDSLRDVSLRLVDRGLWKWLSDSGIGRGITPEGWAGAPGTLRELLLMGFDGVPTLMEHVDDNRLTRSTTTTSFIDPGTKM